MPSSRKKSSKRTGTTSSKTHSVEPPIAGRGVTLQSQTPGWKEVDIDVLHADVLTSPTKKRKQTTSSQLSTLLSALGDGMPTVHASSEAPELSKYFAQLATASKPKPKTIFAERCECDPSKDHYCLEQSELLAEEKAIEGFTPKNELRGLKHDQEKPMLAYIPKAALDAEGLAFAYGAKKYEPFNYRHGIAITRTLSAALRHIVQFLGGEDIDQESGVNHLGCARANLAMALDTLANHPELDDRFKGNK